MNKANKTKKILITGGGGYIGSVVTRYLLEKGFDVRVLDLFVYGRDSLNDLLDNVEVVQGDIRDGSIVKKCLQDVDAVIHLAAIVGAPESNRIPELTWEINYQATRRLVDEIKKKRIPRMIFVSTCSNYGRGGNAFASEAAVLDPVSPYAESKVAAEEYVLSQKDPNFHPVICRLATVFGVSPRMRFDLLVNQFVADAFLKKELTIFGHQGRTFVHVKDVARVFETLLRANLEKISGEVFNVGSTKESNFTKAELGQIVAGLVPGAKLTVLKKDLDARDYKVSFDKISKALGFRTNYSIEDGVREILEYLGGNPDLDPYNPRYSNLKQKNDVLPRRASGSGRLFVSASSPTTERRGIRGFENKKILVTGGAGFLGKYVVEELLNKGCSREDIFVPRKNKLDLTKLENCRRAVEGRDIVIHLAAKVGGIGLNRQKPGELFYENLMMGAQLMEEARKAGVEKFVAVGTVCAYPKFTPIPFKEGDLWLGYPEETNAPYGLAKKMLLVQAQAYRGQYNFNAIYLLPVNLGSGTEVTIKDLANLIKDLVGFKGRIVWDKTKPDGQPRRCLDTSRAAREVGFEAKINLERGIKETIAWYLNSHYLQK